MLFLALPITAAYGQSEGTGKPDVQKAEKKAKPKKKKAKVEEPAPAPDELQPVDATPPPAGTAKAEEKAETPPDEGKAAGGPGGGEAKEVPAAELVAPLAPAKGERDETRKHQVSLVPEAGFGWLSEPELHSSAMETLVGAALEYRPVFMVPILAGFTYSRYDRTYMSDLGGQTLRLSENAYDAALEVRFEVLRYLHIKGGEIAPLLGLRYIRFENETFPLNWMAVPIGLWARVDAAKNLSVTAKFAWAYNFMPGDTISLMGKPLNTFSYEAGLLARFLPWASVSLGYEGETVMLEHSYRHAHAVVLGLAVHAN